MVSDRPCVRYDLYSLTHSTVCKCVRKQYVRYPVADARTDDDDDGDGARAAHDDATTTIDAMSAARGMFAQHHAAAKTLRATAKKTTRYARR